jgi:hypothetical protein
MATGYQRPFVTDLANRLDEAAPLIQVVVGPRQVGKTTGIQQLIDQRTAPAHYASADDLLAGDSQWLREQWQHARLLGPNALLAIDEVQKIPNWPETMKALWDAEARRAAEERLRVVLLGSSAVQIQDGVTESLAGRFELTRLGHWRFCDRWYAYLKDAIVETVIGKDILQFQRVGKPALFRQAFEILCHYPAQEISYTKLLGQLQDRGNTDLIKHYISLYESAFMFHALAKYSAKAWRSRSSSPKMLPACPALYTMHQSELAVGAELAQQPGALYYWREGKAEVDFVYAYRGALYAIEVKSGRRKSRKGLSAFVEQTPDAVPVILTPEHFGMFSADPVGFLERVGG